MPSVMQVRLKANSPRFNFYTCYRLQSQHGSPATKAKKVSDGNRVYTYDSLPNTEGYFRYLVLKPGTGDVPLVCDIHTSRLKDISYEAISYVWGSEQKPKPLLCGGKTISITINLHAALARLRLPDKDRVLWADSVCINYNNLQEKGHQVAQMGRIYRDASHVLICLGADGDEHALRASAIINDVVKIIQTTPATIDTIEWNIFPWSGSDDRILVDERWNSIDMLLRQDWFARGWVVREAAFAQAATMIWGLTDFV